MTIIQKGGKMSTKLVRYKDVCNAVIPIIADMLQNGNIEPAIDTLKALGELEGVDLAEEIKERCIKSGNSCDRCEFHKYHHQVGCFLQNNDNTPEDWKL